MKLIKPSKLKSMAEYAIGWCKFHITDKEFNIKFNLKSTWPCSNCYGNGIIRKWSGIGSDYDYYDCIYCKNTGIISKNAFKEKYDIYVNQHRCDKKLYDERYKQYINIMKKLTKKEVEFLQKYL